MKYTFVHISDLHFRDHTAEGAQLVCRKFLEDLRQTAKPTNAWYLVFSGDMVNAGDNKSDYDMLLKEMDEPLAKLGLPRARRICVPGNHDIERKSIRLRLHNGNIAAFKNEREFNDNVDELSTLILGKKFGNYKSFESAFCDIGCCQQSFSGQGWEVDNALGVYCLNTAICSSGGLKESDNEGEERGRLAIDTRRIREWIQSTKSSVRVLVMHHPPDWLNEWSRKEIDEISASSFNLVLSGHFHSVRPEFAVRGSGAVLSCASPQLYTTKNDILGYAIIEIDSEDYSSSIQYRQWINSGRFVSGTLLSQNDTGVLVFGAYQRGVNHHNIADHKIDARRHTKQKLQEEFEDAVRCYATKRLFWTERSLSESPETAKQRVVPRTFSVDDLARDLKACWIRAPKQYGLSTLGRRLALQHFLLADSGGVLVMMDCAALPSHIAGVDKAIQDRCAELKIVKEQIAGIILDNWSTDQRSSKTVSQINTLFDSLPVILLHGIDDARQIADNLSITNPPQCAVYYLWALSRSQIRGLVSSHLSESDILDENSVTKKVIEDVDALNIPRSPMNCLMIFKLIEQVFDDSPVNRTDMISRVLYLLFCQFNKIPRYAAKPDLKDCEYAIGYVAEWLIKNNRFTFSKNEFSQKINKYCEDKLFELDTSLLFEFLLSENILIRRDVSFEFRFKYWLYYFAAHRMHHDSAFAEYILQNQRYSAYPEIIEFYTGIDRRRSDAIDVLTVDLRSLNQGFSKRTLIPETFDPYAHAKWSPNSEWVDDMRKSIDESVAGSSLPQYVKDDIADSRYDRAKPYNQEIAKFIEESSLPQMISTMQGAARALRNSDHVQPSCKEELLVEVIACWQRICQTVAFVAHLLASDGYAAFDGMGFMLVEPFDSSMPQETRWKNVMSCIIDNVIEWHQLDLFSKKLGPLFGKFVAGRHGTLAEALVVVMLCRQRPAGWDNEVEEFIVRSQKNNFYLATVFNALVHEYHTAFVTENGKRVLRRLAGMALAKHATGSKRPNAKLIDRAASQITSRPGDSNSETG